ncbi:MAG: hypothetical protein ACTSUB_06005 [Candidatus Thorarchaeota archaeon]
MADTSFFSRRLMNSEVLVWLEVGKKTDSNDSTEYSKKYMKLGNAMAFVSYIGEDLIGGTAIYKDPIRQGMALINVRIGKEYRDQATTQILKTAIPFFKSASIKDVDVILNPTTDNSPIPCPINSELESWTKDGLEKIGFEVISKIYYVTATIPDSKYECGVKWDAELNLEGLQKLFWKHGAQCSNLSFLLDLQKHEGNLKTSSVTDETQLVMGFSLVKKKWMVTTVFHNTDLIDKELVARTILAETQKMKLQHIVFPILSEEQLQLVKTLENLGMNLLETRELVLMRKTL